MSDYSAKSVTPWRRRVVSRRRDGSCRRCAVAVKRYAGARSRRGVVRGRRGVLDPRSGMSCSRGGGARRRCVGAGFRGATGSARGAALHVSGAALQVLAHRGCCVDAPLQLGDATPPWRRRAVSSMRSCAPGRGLSVAPARSRASGERRRGARSARRCARSAARTCTLAARWCRSPLRSNGSAARAALFADRGASAMCPWCGRRGNIARARRPVAHAHRSTLHGSRLGRARWRSGVQ